jgi:hypothetical protein
VAILPVQDLRRDVVWRSADGPSSLTIKLQLRGKTKITNLNLHFLIDEQITQLQIPMDDSMLMEILHCTYDLEQIALHLKLRKSFSTLEQLIHGLVLSNLEHDIYIF